MITKITSFTAHQTAEGMRIAFTYSKIDADGNLVDSNKRATVIVLAQDVLDALGNVEAWLLGKVPQ